MYAGYMSYMSYVGHMSIFMNGLKSLVFCFNTFGSFWLIYQDGKPKL